MLALVGASVAQAGERFPRPAGLEAQVEFWRAIFTRHSVDEVLVHDALHVDKVYEVLDFTRYREAGLGEDELRKLRKAVGEQALSRVREALLAIHRNGGTADGLGPAAQKVHGIVGPGPADRFLAAASEKRLRTQQGLREQFAEGIRTSRRYLPAMEGIFAAEGLPLELTRLPLIESTFNVRAYSKVGAAGIWQFIPSTGRRFMRIDGLVDDRRDPIRSTRAAAGYLRELYGILGSWPLAITAYNHGPVSIARGVREVGSRDIDVLVREYRGETFGFASRNFYAEFLAALDVERDPERYYGPLEFPEPLQAEERSLERALGIGIAADLAGIPTDVLAALNPALSPQVVAGRHYIPAGYRLRLPRGAHDQFDRGFGEMLVEAAARAEAEAERRKQIRRTQLSHRIRPGETLLHIARRHRVSVERLAEVNKISRPDRIRAGQVIKIPLPVSTSERAT